MSGSLSGHGSAWPLPNVTSAALDVALHRAGFAADGHTHRASRSGHIHSEDRDTQARKFGSLATAGPFPVVTATKPQGGEEDRAWFFPRPLDAGGEAPVLLPG